MKKVLFFVALLFTPSLWAAPTVVCLHGFMSDYRAMFPMRFALERCGFETFLWDYPSRRYTIECHATHLITELQGIARCKPGEPIHFVTHSIGALIVRAALNLPGCPEEAKMGKAVLVAPPNQGSSLARRMGANPVSSYAMGDGAGSELIVIDGCDIERCFGNFPEGMEVLVIAGCQGVHTWFDDQPNDGYLSIDETYLNTTHQHIIFPLTHSTLLTACPSINCAVQFLLAAPCKKEMQNDECKLQN